ncbi:MAG: hypothetical protein R3A52_07025 [Polyangiales bacterium]
MRAAIALAVVGALACKRSAAPSPAPTPSPAVTAPADAPAAVDAPPERSEPESVNLRGAFTGQSVDPPLRELDRSMTVAPWRGRGELTVTVPPREGEVRGEMRADGFVLRLRGWRTEQGVRATLDQETDAGEGVWRGLLDGVFEGGALRGTWAASADGGRNARGGTFEAR